MYQLAPTKSELCDLAEDEADSTKLLRDKIVDAILDALELQLELKLSHLRLGKEAIHHGI